MSVHSRTTQVEAMLSPREIAMLHLEAIDKFIKVAVARVLKRLSETEQKLEALAADITDQEGAWLKERFKRIPKKWTEADMIPLLREVRDVKFYKTLALDVNVRCLDIAQDCKDLVDRSLAQMLFLRPLPKFGETFLDAFPPWRVTLESKIHVALCAGSKFRVQTWQHQNGGGVISERFRVRLQNLVQSGVILKGAVASFSLVPPPALRKPPLVEGQWIDQFVIELAEFGQLLLERGFVVQSSIVEGECFDQLGKELAEFGQLL
jgi:hypothetical protein